MFTSYELLLELGSLVIILRIISSILVVPFIRSLKFSSLIANLYTIENFECEKIDDSVSYSRTKSKKKQGMWNSKNRLNMRNYLILGCNKGFKKEEKNTFMEIVNELLKPRWMMKISIKDMFYSTLYKCSCCRRKSF